MTRKEAEKTLKKVAKAKALATRINTLWEKLYDIVSDCLELRTEDDDISNDLSEIEGADNADAEDVLGALESLEEDLCTAIDSWTDEDWRFDEIPDDEDYIDLAFKEIEK